MYIMKKSIIFLQIIIACGLIACTTSTKPDTVDAAQEQAAKQEFYVTIIDTAALSLIDQNAAFEILAEGFYWSEGPLWVSSLNALLFSDVPANKIYKWSENDSLQIYLESAGHSGTENIASGKGPNGLMLDAENKLIICQHGDRRIARMDAAVDDPKAAFVSLAASFMGKDFNSPNDLTMDSSGNIYFTDPPYGRDNNLTGDIGFNGVYKVDPESKLTLLLDSLSWPNGIAVSLDEQSLYINQSSSKNPYLYRYQFAADGSLDHGEILFDFSKLASNGKGLPDGLKVHQSGNIFATGPGGVHIISPEGKLLASINTGKATANCAFDDDFSYLYTTTTDRLIRIKLK